MPVVSVARSRNNYLVSNEMTPSNHTAPKIACGLRDPLAARSHATVYLIAVFISVQKHAIHKMKLLHIAHILQILLPIVHVGKLVWINYRVFHDNNVRTRFHTARKNVESCSLVAICVKQHATLATVAFVHRWLILVADADERVQDLYAIKAILSCPCV